MTTLEKMIKIEKKYQNMDDGTSVLLRKVEENNAIEVVTRKFKSFLLDKGLNELNASVVSDIVGFNMIIFEEALKQEVEKRKIGSIDLEVFPDKNVKKEKIKNFKATVMMLSSEYLRGKAEKTLFLNVLDRMERKNMRKKIKNKRIK